MAESSLTKRAAVANISSTTMAYVRLYMKNKTNKQANNTHSTTMAYVRLYMKNKTNKQANNTQSRSLPLGLPKQMVDLANICKGPRCSSC